jgi:hypothetical protein
VSGSGLTKIGQDFYPYVMVDWKLEEGEENLGYGLKGSMGITRLVYVPFGANTHQSALKQSQPNQILSYGIGGTPR